MTHFPNSLIFFKNWKITFSFSESKFPVGSSANIMSGSFAKARAIATLCCSPPESCFGK